MTSPAQTESVLDHGFVTLLSHMGDDLMVVNAARVSFSKRSYWQCACGGVPTDEPCCHEPGDYQLQESDAKLINYLARHNHWTPFAHCQVQLHFKMPIFVARQFMRSNVGIIYNEVSRRYVSSEPEFYVPTTWRGKPEKSIKQGSGEILGDLDQEVCHPDYQAGLAACVRCYTQLLERDVAPEQARMVLPLSTYTEFWATMSLHAASRIVSLRSDSHAQWEIQQYAAAISRLIQPHFPTSWAALAPNPPSPVVDDSVQPRST